MELALLRAGHLTGLSRHALLDKLPISAACFR